MKDRTNSRAGRMALSAAVAAFALAACSHFGPLKDDPLPAAPADQGWSAVDRDLWYRGSQGSRLIPERWLLALEAADSTALFMDPAHFERFNYLKARQDDVLPIGFARDVQTDEKLGVTRLRWYTGQRAAEPWIGLNCAACHTSKLTHEGKEFWVDGAPTLADFQGFTDALLLSLRATLGTPDKWDRFATRVLTPRPGEKRSAIDTAANRALLRSAFESHLAHQEDVARFNATQVRYGHDRLDAVGHILDKVALLTRAEGQLRGEPDAPVSYPFIWNASQHDRLQWNGIVPNDKFLLGRGRSLDAGALVRNTSEVIGVFADVQVRPAPGLKGFTSSVNVRNLIAMEIQLARLYSPAWPFERADDRQIMHGQRLFKEQCAGCHADLPRADLKSQVKAEMTPIWAPGGVGTDPWMACNAYTYQARAGLLEGTKSGVVFGDPLPPIAATRNFLKTESVGVLLGKKGSLISSALRIAAGQEPRIRVEGPPPPPPLIDSRTEQDTPDARLDECIAKANSPATPAEERLVLAYKARPLNGVWATAPYLHNGSVKSLWELLLPVSRRTKRFWVGNREFDPVHVGFVDEQKGHGSWFQTTDGGGRPIHGNSNEGHIYGNERLTDEQRWALIAYMKTL
jgi:mono/diheme cytochrome c family protein